MIAKWAGRGNDTKVGWTVGVMIPKWAGRGNDTKVGWTG